MRFKELSGHDKYILDLDGGVHYMGASIDQKLSNCTLKI